MLLTVLTDDGSNPILPISFTISFSFTTEPGITHLQLVPRSRKNVDLYIHYSIRLHDVVLN
jgi:hypothetical protein